MPTLLSTKILNTSQQKKLLNEGINVIQYNAIEIVPQDFEIPERIENAIFTSKNTVERIPKAALRNMNCFCVGKKTKRLLEKNGASVIAWTEYGKDLAELIIEKFRNKKFVFFCGNLRREEIPSILKKNRVDFQEICTYKTELVPKKFEQKFDGILFFSPSGVKSFCIENELKNSAALCIGTTTAAEAKKHSDKIYIAEEPTIESVVQISCKISKTL
ncbi:MAG TPA: uroporphyrinogen-III synthase [Flavobacteriaceae bacterium]|nr:uroporphyrinogen-III synthase [Flavobacteriaceae bacterium]